MVRKSVSTHELLRGLDPIDDPAALLVRTFRCHVEIPVRALNDVPEASTERNEQCLTPFGLWLPLAEGDPLQDLPVQRADAGSTSVAAATSCSCISVLQDIRVTAAALRSSPANRRSRHSNATNAIRAEAPDVQRPLVFDDARGVRVRLARLVLQGMNDVAFQVEP